GYDPAFFPALVDDEVLDRLDADRVIVDVQRTGRLAGCRADAPRELGEVVGGMQHVECTAPLAAVHEIVPVGNDVVDGAAVVAEGNAAVHAAGALLSGVFVVEPLDELLPVAHAHLGRLVALLNALQFKKSGDLAHFDSSGGNVFGVGGLPQFGQGAAVFRRHDLYELAPAALPLVEHVARAEAAGVAVVVFDQAAQQRFVGLALAAGYDTVPHVALGPGLLFGVRQHGFQAHHGRIAAALEAAVGVPDVGHAARHACREVAAGLAQHHHGAAGHVFAAVIPHAFHDRGGARIAHGEAFAGHAVEIGFTGQRTVQHGIAG